MELFAKLADDIERRWLAVDRDEEAFPDIAAAALDALPPARHFDREAFLDAELDPFRSSRRERAPLGAFGQPGVTVRFGRDFVIEVYFWVDSVSGIHDHPFKGVFTILEGFSVHSTYEWTEDDGPQGRLRTGTLTQTGLELLEAGAVRRFSRRAHPLIHALVHVPVPSISMVVRTTRASEYRRFLPPGLSAPWDPPDEVIAVQTAWLEAIAASGDPRATERLDRYLAHADLETCLGLLSPRWGAMDAMARSRRLDAVRARHGAKTDALGEALARYVRYAQLEAVRGQLSDPDDRLVAVALSLGESRDAVLELLRARHDDPVARLHRFVDAVGPHVMGGEATTASSRVLIDGGGREGVLRQLAEAFGEATLEAQRDQIERFLAESMFAALG